jgi:ABC-2 type transport system permease protein
VEGGSADAAFVIPTGFTTAITAGQPTSIDVIGSNDAVLATEVARSVASGFGNAVASVQLATLTVADLRGSQPTPQEIGQIAQLASQPAITLVDSQTPMRQLSWSTYFSASMAILFLFFAAQSGMISLFEERRQGTLARILAGPVRPGTILLGKAIGSLVTGLVAMTILVAATTALIGADWGPPLGVAMIVTAAVLSAIGLTAFVTSFMRTLDGAGAANSAVAITLGILGGTFAPTSQGPELMSTISLVTPHAWFLRGLGDLHGTGATVADALPAVAVLLAMATVTGGIGFARARRLVAPR